VLEQAAEGRDFRNASDKQAAIEDVLPFMRVVKSAIQRQEFLDAAISRFQIDSTHRVALLKSLQLDAANTNRPNYQEFKQQVAEAVQAKPTVAEQDLLELIVHDRELRQAVLPQLEPSDYEHLASAQIFEALIELEANGGEINAENLQAFAGDSDMLSVIFLSETARSDDEAIDEVLMKAENCVITLRQMAIERRLRQIFDELKQAEQAGETERLYALISEQHELSKLKNDLGRIES
jgi:hypothetical protein